MSIWYSPHPKGFLRKLCQALATADEHCAVTIPRHLLQSFQEELLSYGRKSLGELVSLRLDPDGTLLQNLSPLFTLSNKQEAILSELADVPLKRCRTLAIFLPETLLPWEDEFFTFVDEMTAHAKACKDQSRDLSWCMLVVIPFGRKVPREDIGLKLFHWWGCVHVSDVEYAIERAFGCYEEKERHLYCWFYALCKGVASMDPGLVDVFLQNLPTNIDSLIQCLRTHELNTKENGDLVQNYFRRTPPRLSRNEIPREYAAELWQHGILDIDSEGRPSLHPGALVAANQIEELERLVVKGQMQVYLPLVQEVHSFIYRKAEYWLGSGWDAKHKEAYPTLNSEIGPLAFCLENNYRKKIDRQYIETAKKWREIRNSIAHAQMIPFKNAVKAVADYQFLLEEEYD